MLSIIASIIIGALTIFLFLVMPIYNANKEARNWRKFREWRESHNQPFYGQMEEETEKDLWDVY